MELLTKSELAEKLKCSLRTIELKMKEGFKPTIKSPLRFTLEDYIKWQKSQEDKTAIK